MDLKRIFVDAEYGTVFLRKNKTIKPMAINGFVPGARATKVGSIDLRMIEGKIITVGTVFFIDSLPYSTATLRTRDPSSRSETERSLAGRPSFALA